MKITVFTCNQPHYINLVSRLSTVDSNERIRKMLKWYCANEVLEKERSAI